MKRLLWCGVVCLFIAAAMTLSGGQDRIANEGVRRQFVGAWRLARLEQPGADGKIHNADSTKPNRKAYRREHGMNKEPSAAQKMIGDFAPKLVELTDRVLFGDVWERPELSKRERSLATVLALIAMNRPDQLRFHLNYAVQNGVRKEELIEVITHLAFYSGWPNAMSAIMVAKEVLSKG